MKIASAIQKHALEFDDSSFESGINLNEVPAKISKLIQNTKIASQITKNDWELPIDDLEVKIEKLCSVRKSLI